MKYRVREGIVLKNVCDVWMLVAVGKAAEHCLYVRQVNDSLAWYWQRIEAGKTAREIAEETAAVYEVSADRAERDIRKLFLDLEEKGYLIPEEGGR